MGVPKIRCDYGGLHHKDHSILGSISALGFWVWGLEFGV